MVKMIKHRCPVCKMLYKYPECAYIPKTCDNFDCAHKYHRNPAIYKTLMCAKQD